MISRLTLSGGWRGQELALGFRGTLFTFTGFPILACTLLTCLLGNATPIRRSRCLPFRLRLLVPPTGCLSCGASILRNRPSLRVRWRPCTYKMWLQKRLRQVSLAYGRVNTPEDGVVLSASATVHGSPAPSYFQAADGVYGSGYPAERAVAPCRHPAGWRAEPLVPHPHLAQAGC